MAEETKSKGEESESKKSKSESGEKEGEEVMGVIIDLLGKVFNRKGEKQEGGNPLIGLTGRPLNPLYNPKPRKDDFDKCDKELDDWMRSMGYRKYRTAENGLPRPKRRFLKRSERMEVGDTKIMFGINRLKK